MKQLFKCKRKNKHFIFVWQQNHRMNLWYVYNNLYGLKSTGLRFLLANFGGIRYGNFYLSKNIINEEPIELYNYGGMKEISPM